MLSNVLQSLNLHSRTISWAVFLGLLVLFPEFHQFVSGIFEVLPETVEGAVDSFPLLELLSLAGIVHGRLNVRAKVN